MVDGIYDIVSDTPLGKRRGTLELESEGERLIARIEMMGMQQGAEGTVDGDAFTLAGETRVMLRRFSYQGSGRVRQGKLTGTLHALDQDFAVKGKLRPAQ